jgi:beta-glucosidase/6-phospho-beta-glucosidase/beta-galactosidase
MSKPSFPKDFHWGYATASAQVEGSIDADGKSRNIWDTFSADPSHAEDGGNTSVATDFYNLYKQDTQMMKEFGESGIVLFTGESGQSCIRGLDGRCMVDSGVWWVR